MSTYAKAIAAFVLALLNYLTVLHGLFPDARLWTTILDILTPIGVWVVPNAGYVYRNRRNGAVPPGDVV